MSLETRVATLEHELKILKNEIERTLLEIQNQVLIHYYPSLRAEDTTPPKDLQPLLESAFTEKEEDLAGTMANHKEADVAPPLPPKAKEVSLTEIQRKPKKGGNVSAPESAPPQGETAPTIVVSKPAKAAALAKVRPPQHGADKIDQAVLPILAKWVNESVEKIGKALAQNMVESSANNDQSTPEVADLLLQFITLCDEENPPEEIDTKELMDVLLKLDKMMGQVNKLLEQAPPENGEEHG